jgi:hypothetical protein
MVRFHSQAVQGRRTIFSSEEGETPAKEYEMTAAAARRIAPELLSPEGELLVFAPPILIGFLGAPLALAGLHAKRRNKSSSGKNWAKRRAYGS